MWCPGCNAGTTRAMKSASLFVFTFSFKADALLSSSSAQRSQPLQAHIDAVPGHGLDPLPELDLKSLTVVLANTSSSRTATAGQQKQATSTDSAQWGARLTSARWPSGEEFACLNCDPELFSDWVEAVMLGSHHTKRIRTTDSGRMKHPNAPGYDRWEKATSLSNTKGKSSRAAFLSETGLQSIGKRNATAKSSKAQMNLTVTALNGFELEAVVPHLRELWAKRRLVLGPGPDPMHQRQDFVQSLVHLARESPSLVPEDCGEHGQTSPHCGALLSGGLSPIASTRELWSALARAFGQRFLDKHRFNSQWTPKEQRSHVQAVLTALKESYTFYKASCLVDAPGLAARGCDSKGSSAMLGRVACSPEEDGIVSRCMYAELRQCGAEACKAANDATGFFEYTRLHGPIALFDTSLKRSRIMGQCEEFSRAGYALLASLGYEARYVLDFTDHVWVEVKLPPANGTQGAPSSWVHADPSEGILDAPLMYEQGWGKQLTMIFAFSPWAVEHVTRRYTEKYEETVARRGVTDVVLNEVISEANRRLKFELPLNSWGFGSGAKPLLSKDRSFEELALWSHFDM